MARQNKRLIVKIILYDDYLYLGYNVCALLLSLDSFHAYNKPINYSSS